MIAEGLPGPRTGSPGSGRTAGGATVSEGAPSRPGTRGAIDIGRAAIGPNAPSSNRPIIAKSAGRNVLAILSSRGDRGLDMSRESRGGYISLIPLRAQSQSRGVVKGRFRR